MTTHDGNGPWITPAEQGIAAAREEAREAQAEAQTERQEAGPLAESQPQRMERCKGLEAEMLDYLYGVLFDLHMLTPAGVRELYEIVERERTRLVRTGPNDDRDIGLLNLMSDLSHVAKTLTRSDAAFYAREAALAESEARRVAVKRLTKEDANDGTR